MATVGLKHAQVALSEGKNGTIWLLDFQEGAYNSIECPHPQRQQNVAAFWLLDFKKKHVPRSL